jgi:hypothetical protein
VGSTGGISSQPRFTIFIPASRATPDEVAERREALRNEQLTEKQIDDYIGDGHLYVYRDRDLRAAFPSLRDTDERFSLCSNSIAAGATEIVFVSEPTDRTIEVKTASCSLADEGLWCSAMSETRAYFRESPRHIFFLHGATLEEADAILDAFEEHGVPGLSGLAAMASPLNIRSITATPDGYRLKFGEFICGGCETAFVVQFDGEQSRRRLALVGEAKGVCI